MDSAAATQAMRNGDLQGWVMALDWDEVVQVELPACQCGVPMPEDITYPRAATYARAGQAIIAVVPAGHSAPDVQFGRFASEEEAHDAIQGLATGTRELILAHEAALGVIAVERYANTV